MLRARGEWVVCTPAQTNKLFLEQGDPRTGRLRVIWSRLGLEAPRTSRLATRAADNTACFRVRLHAALRRGVTLFWERSQHTHTDTRRQSICHHANNMLAAGDVGGLGEEKGNSIPQWRGLGRNKRTRRRVGVDHGYIHTARLLRHDVILLAL